MAAAGVARSLNFSDDSGTRATDKGYKVQADGDESACNHPENLKVVLRIRPLTADERERNEEVAVTVKDDDREVDIRSRARGRGALGDFSHSSFRFSTILDPECSQEDVFKATAEPLVNCLFRGRDALIFAYGTTNAGKTYTIQGSAGLEDGIIQKASRLVVSRMVEANAQADDSDGEYEVHVSFMEIYNEQCYDLLDRGAQKDRPALRIKHDAQGTAYVDGLERARATRLDEVEEALRGGLRRRRVAETVQNERSSRSHTIFTLHLERYRSPTDGVTELVESSRLAIVDLAGSERSSAVLDRDRERMRETAQINKSLMNLGRCLEVLRENQRRKDAKKMLVPYRQSRLTRLFQPILERGTAVMVANISPLLRDADETVHALSCAALACQVQVGTALAVAPTVLDNRDMNKENAWSGGNLVCKTPKSSSLVTELNREHRRNVVLREEVRRLQTALSRAETRVCLIEAEVRAEVAEEMEEVVANMEAEYVRRLDDACGANERRMERRIELITKTARKQMTRRRALADAETEEPSGKYRQMYQEELDLREFQEEVHAEQRVKLLEHIEDLEALLKRCTCADAQDMSLAMGADSTAAS